MSSHKTKRYDFSKTLVDLHITMKLFSHHQCCPKIYRNLFTGSLVGSIKAKYFKHRLPTKRF